MRRAFLTEIDPTTGQPKYTLESILEDEGSNLSVGERSLVSLARALARDAKIVILDEATASVDLETDSRIQETIRVEFKDKTLLTIGESKSLLVSKMRLLTLRSVFLAAHRLRTILAYTKIVVMDAGRVVEYDTPLNLYDRENGIFRSMVRALLPLLLTTTKLTSSTDHSVTDLLSPSTRSRPQPICATSKIRQTVDRRAFPSA